ncbi:MAG TPA: DUF1819 family protein [Bacilli bacterium]|jgi:hypothetical protein|nr:DUF1819 family protein [Bacilli bacterium]
MNKKVYSSAIKKTPFEYLPSKIIAKMIQNGLLYEEAFDRCVNQNELNVVSDERRKEIFNVCYDRLVNLDNTLLKEFIDGSISTSKFILVYAIASNDPLFLEFLLIQYRDTLLGNKKYISISDFDDFFNLMKEKNAVVAKWTDTTLKQLAGGYRNILVESGLGERIKKNIYSRNVIVSPNVIKRIENIGDKAFLQAVLGVK